MCLVLLFLITFVWISLLTHCSSSTNQLNGQHLRVIWPRWSGNPKGLSGPLKGGVLLEYLSTRLNFTYEMVRVVEELEPEAGRGQINYVIDKQCDLLIQSVLATIRRNQIVDLTLPWVYDSSAFLIPIPDEIANTNAVVKPFQWPIWLGLGLSIICVIITLNFLQQTNHRLREETDTMQPRNEESAKVSGSHLYLYVFGNLLSQGEPCPSKGLPFRLVAGVWCLAAFFFVQAYNSTLFTYVVAPVHQPLIKSIYDVFENPDIHLLVRTGTIDLLLKKNNNTGVFLKIEKKLDSYANSRCGYGPECVQRITPGSKNVYFEAKNYLKDAIRTEFKRTGKCNLQFAKEGFTGVTSSLALPKHSPYTQSMTQGILELHQTGIIDYWDLWFRPMPPQCDGKNKLPTRNKVSRLSFKNMTGAFIVLGVGLSLSVLAFFGEKIISIIPCNHSEVQVVPIINDNVEELKEESPPIIQEELIAPTESNIELTNVTEVEENVELVEENLKLVEEDAELVQENVELTEVAMIEILSMQEFENY